MAQVKGFIVVWVLMGVVVDLGSKKLFFNELEHVRNPGIFMGWFDSYIWILVPPLFFWFLYNELKKADDNLQILAICLLLSGGIGNWLDRLLTGSVRDFIYYPVIEVWGNVADIYITLAVLLLGAHYLYTRNQRHA